MKEYYICQTIGRPFTTTNGSLWNHQSGGAVTKVYFTDGSVLNVQAGAFYDAINWNTVSKIRTC